MAELFESGKTLEEVGAQFGVSRQRVHQILSAQGYHRYDGGKSFKGYMRHKQYAEDLERRWTVPDKRVAPLFLELGERLETSDARKALKELLMWLANSPDDRVYTKSAILQQVEYLTRAPGAPATSVEQKG